MRVNTSGSEPAAETAAAFAAGYLAFKDIGMYPIILSS